MPLPRFQRLEPEKRAQLLSVAAEEFSSKGYEAASLNDILAAADLGKSSYYNYFADKEDLYATLIEDTFARVDAKVPRPNLFALDADTFWPALDTYTTAMSAAIARSPNFVNLLRPLQGVWRAPTPRFEPIVEKMRAHYREGIEAGQALGCVRTDLDVDWLISIVQAADAALDEHLMNQWQIDPEGLQAHARLAFDTIRRLLEPGEPELRRTPSKVTRLRPLRSVAPLG